MLFAAKFAKFRWNMLTGAIYTCKNVKVSKSSRMKVLLVLITNKLYFGAIFFVILVGRAG